MNEIKCCPVGTCNKKVMPSQAMCQNHWEKVPEEFQVAIRTHKKNRSSDAWNKAVREAVSQVTAEEALERETEQFISWWKGG